MRTKAPLPSLISLACKFPLLPKLVSHLGQAKLPYITLEIRRDQSRFEEGTSLDESLPWCNDKISGFKCETVFCSTLFYHTDQIRDSWNLYEGSELTTLSRALYAPPPSRRERESERELNALKKRKRSYINEVNGARRMKAAWILSPARRCCSCAKE
jgi:hypothetical protein